MWACGNIVSRAVGRHGPINQVAFVVWASLVPPLPLLALSWLIEGPAAIGSALQHFSLQSFAAVAYIAWASTLFGYAVWNFLMSRYAAKTHSAAVTTTASILTACIDHVVAASTFFP